AMVSGLSERWVLLSLLMVFSCLLTAASTVILRQYHQHVTMRDITAVNKATEALRASEERYRRLFENVAEGVYQSTASGKIVIANPALEKLLGYSEEELRQIDVGRDLYINPED